MGVPGPEEALLEVGGLLLARDDAQQERAAGLDRDDRQRDDAGGDPRGVGELDHEVLLVCEHRYRTPFANRPSSP